MCTIDGGERADVFTWNFRRARKEHRCEACGGAIQPGRLYGILFTVFEGSAGSSKCCVSCHRIGEKFGEEHDFFPHPTGLTDALQECVAEEPASARKWRAALRAMSTRRALL